MNRFERLRNYLSEKEKRILSANELARILGVSNSTIASTENESRPPSPKVAARLEEKYGISREWYLTGEGLAPWEEKEYEDYFKDLDEMERVAEEENIPPTLEKGLSCFVAGKRIFKTSETKLVDYFIEAGRNPEFRRYLYKVLYNILEGGAVNIFQQLQKAREKAEMEKEYKKDKFPRKEFRMVADKGQQQKKEKEGGKCQ